MCSSFQGSSSIGPVSHDGAIYSGSGSARFIEKPNFKMVIRKIREQVCIEYTMTYICKVRATGLKLI